MNKVLEMQLAFSLSTLLSNGSRKLDFDYWCNNIERNTYNIFCLEQKQNSNRQLFEEWSNMLEQLSDDDYANFQPTKICSLQIDLPSTVKEWCDSCWYPNAHKCLNECLGLDEIIQMFLKDDCVLRKNPGHSRNLIDLFLSSNFGNYERVIKEYFQRVDESIGIHPLTLWSALNAPYLNDGFELSYMNPLGLDLNDSLNMSMKDLSTKLGGQENINRLISIMKTPRVDDYSSMMDYVLIPLCRFGNRNLDTCALFQETKPFYLSDNVCYTLNYQGSYWVKNTKAHSGLNFVLNFRLPSHNGLTSPKLVIHPNGVVPDLERFSASTLEIKKGFQYKIGINVDVTNITDSFSAMDLSKRKCKLNSDSDYNSINCKMMKAIKKGLDSCGCTPWFFEDSSNNSICIGIQAKCFDEAFVNASNQDWKKECPLECIYSEYSLTSTETEMPKSGAVYNHLRSSFGHKWLNYSSEDNPMLSNEYNKYGGMVSKSALIHVNFQKPFATITTKDAKVTFSDMLGTIGGTFGVFLGLSFVGVLDFCLILWTWTREMYRKFTAMVKS